MNLVFKQTYIKQANINYKITFKTKHMGQMNIVPEKVEELIRRFNQHTQNTINSQRQLKGNINQLQQFWNDSNYKSVVEQFNEFDKMISKAIQLSETVIIPNLKNIKRLQENLKNGK
jgi:uncharacterized protein YukE